MGTLGPVLGLGWYRLWEEPPFFPFPLLLNMVVEGPFFCLQWLPLLASQMLTPELRASETKISRMARPFDPRLIFVPATLYLSAVRRWWQCLCVLGAGRKLGRG